MDVQSAAVAIARLVTEEDRPWMQTLRTAIDALPAWVPGIASIACQIARTVLPHVPGERIETAVRVIDVLCSCESPVDCLDEVLSQ